jgi:hypothetical protein
MKVTLPIVLIPLLLASVANSQTISFYKEEVGMKLDASHFSVTGEYSFRNNYGAEASQTIFFPLIATGELKVDSFYVYDESAQSYFKNVRKLRSGLFFQLTLYGHQTKKIRIFYMLDHDGTAVKYLAKTNIGYWKSPVSQVIYTLQIDDPSVIVDSTSFKPDDILTRDSRITYFWRKADFLPDKELEIWFHHK